MKRLIAILICIVTAGLVSAGKVSLAEALKTAQALMPGEKLNVLKYSSPSAAKGEQEPFYIFNKADGNGFVLVSADDRTTAILGYSLDGNIDLSDLPDNVRYWLESYARQIQALDKGVTAVKTAKTRTALDNIEPLIQARWNQGRPYNLMCPDGNGHDYDEEDYDPTNRSVSGCVATAVAQVMYHYQRPTLSTAIPSYTYTLNKSKITLKELPAATFDWEAMRPTYTSSDTDEGAQAVAMLMRYVGQACEMLYNTAANGGSGAIIQNDKMIDCFGYSKQMHTLERDYYTTEQWEAMVYDELASQRPLPYGGYEDNGGHQFICDGYQDGLFHFNWGWGGRYNGYFVLSIADPDATDGIGGGSGAFKYVQDAVFHFMPAEANEEEIPYMRSIVATKYPAQVYTRGQESEPFTGITLTATYKPVYDYTPTTDYYAEVGWALYQNEQFKECVGFSTPDINFADAENTSKKQTNEVTDVTFSPTLPDGKYQLRQVFRKAGTDDDWTLMDNYGTNYLVAEISGSSLTVRSTDKISLFHVNSIGISANPVEGRSTTVTVNITNDGETNGQELRLWISQDGESWTEVAHMPGFVDPENTGDVVLYFTPSAGGTFTLKVTSDKSKTALATAPITVTKLGDANGDGMVTVTDAAAVSSYISGGAPTGFNETAADANVDGSISVTDAIMTIDLILKNR